MDEEPADVPEVAPTPDTTEESGAPKKRVWVGRMQKGYKLKHKRKWVPKAVTTLEEKKAIPRHLRGARTKRWWCKICETWHGYPENQCKKHANYQNMKENQREAGRRMQAEYAAPLARERMKVASNRMEKARQLAEGRKRFKENGWFKGANSSQYGVKHTPERIAKQKATRAMNKARKDLVRRQVAVEAERQELEQLRVEQRTPVGGFPAPVGERTEFSGGEHLTGWTRRSDDFDPFG